ncbi:MAG: hypothetical protein ACOC79_01230 [Thermodesulfobacteriota bacterium]
MKKIGKGLSILSLCAAFMFFACEDKGPMEKAGEKVDETVEEAGDKVEKAGDKAEEATD